MYLVMYAPLVDGEMDESRCYCREAILCTWLDEDSGEIVPAYAIPDPLFVPADKVTVTELNQSDAIDLAVRCKNRAAEVKGGEWGYKVVLKESE